MINLIMINEYLCFQPGFESIKSQNSIKGSKTLCYCCSVQKESTVEQLSDFLGQKMENQPLGGKVFSLS